MGNYGCYYFAVYMVLFFFGSGWLIFTFLLISSISKPHNLTSKIYWKLDQWTIVNTSHERNMCNLWNNFFFFRISYFCIRKADFYQEIRRSQVSVRALHHHIPYSWWVRRRFFLFFFFFVVSLLFYLVLRFDKTPFSVNRVG